MKTKTFYNGLMVYETPRCNIVEICSEGLLCESGANGYVEHDGIFGDDESIL